MKINVTKNFIKVASLLCWCVHVFVCVHPFLQPVCESIPLLSTMCMNTELDP